MVTPTARMIGIPRDARTLLGEAVTRVEARVGPVMRAAGATVEHVELVMVSSIRVTSPLRASARPSSVTPVAIVIEVRARIVPTKVEPEPRVAELVTCQKTLQAWPPLTKPA